MAGVAVYALTADAETVDCEYTNADGNYDVSGLADGTYRLQALARSGLWLSEYWNNAASLSGASDIHVTVSEPTTLADARLEATPPVPFSLSPTSAPTVSPTSVPTSTPTATPTTPAKITAITKPRLRGKPIAKQTSTKLKLVGKVGKAVAGKAIRVELKTMAPGYITVTTALKVPGKVKLPKKHERANVRLK